MGHCFQDIDEARSSYSMVTDIQTHRHADTRTFATQNDYQNTLHLHQGPLTLDCDLFHLHTYTHATRKDGNYPAWNRNLVLQTPAGRFYY